MTRWRVADPCDPEGRALADRHYSRRNPGTPRFVPPGRALVLTQPGAVWVTHRTQFADHTWTPSWGNTLFRREADCGGGQASTLILEALGITRDVWGLPPEPWGLITFVDAGSVRPKRDPGRCYLRAGFELVGRTAGGHGRPSLHVFSLPPGRWPDAIPAFKPQAGLFG